MRERQRAEELKEVAIEMEWEDERKETTEQPQIS